MCILTNNSSNYLMKDKSVCVFGNVKTLLQRKKFEYNRHTTKNSVEIMMYVLDQETFH